ncbi:hypothetical protein PHYSODRAFT_405339, partial [Phytophthora sojae]
AADMPDLLWGEAFQFSVDVGNICATTAEGGGTPYFRRFGDRPDLRKSKLENPGKPGLFMGYAKHSECYRGLSLVTGNLQEVRSVEFQEGWTVGRSYVERVLKNRY